MHSFVGILSSALSLFARMGQGSFAIWLLGAREQCFLPFLYQVALQFVWKALVQSRAVSNAARANDAKPSPGCSSDSLVGTGLSRLIDTGR